ncbi:DUF6476 family protein [Rhodophyticola sp.]|jgi:hypothetical protein|uniref:DUF6476 family protein n=1 Tax=Rhodophyticola sp. TaxID=2680032 RepID=UPI001B18C02F|nr:hypothetical protein [Roseicyclus sp.]MBO6626639.1 hypothetical protein [Roseicyclus sp.]MBO6924290.1 hypothetical protein [Roseicyclus sp.]
MNDTPQDDNDPPLPGHLKLLRNLVTVLTVVMIGGVITIVALLVIRMSGAPAPALVFPDSFPMPAGVAITGYSQTGTAAILVSDDDHIRVFDLATGEMTHEIDLAD